MSSRTNPASAKAQPPLTVAEAQAILSRADQHSEEEIRRALDVWLAANDEDDEPPETAQEIIRRLEHQNASKDRVYLRRYEAQARPRTTATEASSTSETTLTKNGWKLLNFLDKHHPLSVMQIDLEAATDELEMSRRTIGKILAKLRDARLTHRPNGERGGEAITELGRQVVSRLNTSH